jgi:hypothetical protein
MEDAKNAKYELTKEAAPWPLIVIVCWLN